MLIRPARHFLLSDLRQLANPPHVAYTHLDWLPPEERLQDDSTFVLYDQERLRAAIGLAAETPNFAWLRFFYSLQDAKHQQHFQALLAYGRKWLAENKIDTLYSLSHQDWFENMLIKNGFSKAKQIIALTTNKPTLKHHDFDPGLIQTITAGDISLISHLDAQCFSDPWRLNRLSLRYCIGSADLASCIKLDGQAVAYQVSHVLFDHIHIARLAVHPQYQGKGYATALLSDLIKNFNDQGNYVFSVNTQEDNHASIALYKKLGFQENQESFPVFKLKTS